MLEQWSDQLDLLIRADTPLIWIRSAEEERVQNLLQQAVNRLGNRRLATWNFIDGLGGALNSNGLGARQPMAILQWLQELDSNNPTLLLLKDFHRFCDDPGIARMLRTSPPCCASNPTPWCCAPAPGHPRRNWKNPSPCSTSPYRGNRKFMPCWPRLPRPVVTRWDRMCSKSSPMPAVA